VVTALANGTVTITYKTTANANGCVSTAVFSLSITPPAFTINGNVTNIKCYGGSDGTVSISVTGGSGPYQYRWQDGSSATVISNLVAGTYAVAVNEYLHNAARRTVFL